MPTATDVVALTATVNLQVVVSSSSSTTSTIITPTLSWSDNATTIHKGSINVTTGFTAGSTVFFDDVTLCKPLTVGTNGANTIVVIACREIVSAANTKIWLLKYRWTGTTFLTITGSQQLLDTRTTNSDWFDRLKFQVRFIILLHLIMMLQ